MSKVTIGKKFITITPKPSKFVLGGLKVRFNRDRDTVIAYATTDIIADRSRYLKPDVDDRFVIEAFLNEPTRKTETNS